MDIEVDFRPLGARARRELGCPGRGQSGSNKDISLSPIPGKAAPPPHTHRPPLPSRGSRGDELEDGPGLLSDVRLRDKCAHRTTPAGPAGAEPETERGRVGEGVAVLGGGPAQLP